MKQFKIFNYCQLLVMLFVFVTACKKQNEFLDAKSNDDYVVPTTLADFQALLDNSGILNYNYISIGLTGIDNYYLVDNTTVTPVYFVNAFLWKPDVFGITTYDGGYTQAYIIVRSANIALEGLAKITETADNRLAYDSVKGHALFLRAFMFYNLVNTYAKQYNKVTASGDLGIPIRTFTDANILVQRSSVQDTYQQIISDLNGAVASLPVTARFVMRPSKLAAYALLAKAYLQMEEYAEAKKCCDSVLMYKNSLLNFTDPSISLSVTYRFPTYTKGNPEILYYAEGAANAIASPGTTVNKSYVDTVLYNSYSDNDLRKTLFYTYLQPQKARIIGTYTGGRNQFAGLGINEVFFMRAECNVRLNNLTDGLKDMNDVLRNRYKPGTYVDYVTSNADSALATVLMERRKEFPSTGQIRWEDLKRLNNDSRFAKKLTRVFEGKSYSLEPGDINYVYPFNNNILQQEGLIQNNRH
ncbi:SusD family protein [Filimonas lacunae]|uniref:SusD family protein n=1 Tax=Filimonas lacunae TaxID=477680 RepID=A0A173MQY6_9BACT|nr:RagB/SusD family nutrient uptake outer membrane protein [Filimonas lacunae]BAV10085.1 hypothetical protein FLA_6140 [Filimonas lacunae]SIS83776.1 SusD family protein [Filimonas lacunae]